MWDESEVVQCDLSLLTPWTVNHHILVVTEHKDMCVAVCTCVYDSHLFLENF